MLHDRESNRRRTRAVALLTLALLAALLASNDFIRMVPPLSLSLAQRLRFGGSFLPSLWMALVLAVAAWRSGADSDDDAARVSAFGVLVWCGAVALVGMRGGPTPPFFWGALAPYALAVTVALVVFCLRPDEEALVAAHWIVALVVAAAVVLDAETGWRVGEIRRPSGLLANRNYAGEYLGLAVPVALATLRRRWQLVALLLVGAALASTRCRAGWLGALVGSAVVVCAQRRRGVAVAGVAAVVLGGLVAAVSPSRLAWSDHSPLATTALHLADVGSGSGAVRVRQYWETLRLVRGRPAGLGPGLWQTAMAEVAPELAVNKNPHSDYLRALADGGVASLVGLVALFAAAAWAAARHGRERPAALGFVAALAVVAAADCPFYRPETVVLAMCWLRAGVAAPARA